MKKLLVLGASEFQIPLLKQAKRMGVHTCVIDINPNASGICFADEYKECSLKDHALAIEIAKAYNPDGVTVGMCDVAVRTCAMICEALNLPGLSVEVAENATDKFKMIEVFRANHVPHPEYIYFAKGEYTREKMTLPLPIIVKPIDMAGSRGINLVTTEEELKMAVEDSISLGDKGDIIVEEYMTGPEVSVEIFVENSEPYVMQITDKLTSGAPHFMELGHSQPSSLSESIKMSIAQVACKAVKALGLNNCVAHAEIIVTKEGPKMVEIGARMGGDGIQQQLIQLSTGINLPEAVIKLAMGDPVKKPTNKIHLGSAIRFIPAVTGVIESISNNYDSNDKRINTVRLLCKPGDYYDEAKDNSGRYGYVISQAETAESAIEACEKAISSINIVVMNNG